MNAGFEALRVTDGVWHIRDAMGVCVTLIAGLERAVLVDTAYGIGDLKSFVRSLTDLPLEVVLTHGHHDHALGAMGFESAGVLPGEEEVFKEYTCFSRRERVLEQAAAKGIVLSGREREEYLERPMPPLKMLKAGDMDLGGVTARVVPCPGHTPGSLAVWIPEKGILLPGDNYNPCTWVFFHEALGPRAYRENTKKLLSLSFDTVLCPHDHRPRTRKNMEDFLRAIGDAGLEGAIPSRDGEGAGVETLEVLMPDGQKFVFSREKYGLGL